MSLNGGFFSPEDSFFSTVNHLPRANCHWETGLFPRDHMFTISMWRKYSFFLRRFGCGRVRNEDISLDPFAIEIR